MPFPGLFVVKFCSVKISPFFIFLFAIIDFLATILFLFSELVTILSQTPKHFSIIRIPSHNFFNSSGVTDAL